MDRRRRAFLLDMDGVIVDSNPIHRRAWIEYTRSQGHEADDRTVEYMYGRRNDQIVRAFLGERLTEAEVFAHGVMKEKLYRDLIGPMLPGVLVPGLREFLDRYYEQVPIACATNADAENLNFVIENCGLAKYFRALVSGKEVTDPKPHPEIYLKAAEHLKVAPENCLVFEDSFSGVEAGRAAGMQVVGIKTTHHHLPGTVLAIDDFWAPELANLVEAYLA